MDAQQRADIITYARNTVVQNGVRALRMDDVAQAVHVSKRTLYETFGDKEELLFLAVQDHFDIFDKNNLLAIGDETNILIAMLIVMEEIRKNAEVNWNLRRSLKQFYPKINDRLLNDKADAKRKIVTNSIKAAVEQGYVDKGVNIELAVNMFNYIAIGITDNNDMITIPNDISVDDAFIEVLTCYMRGISTIKGVEVINNYLERENE